MTTKTTLTPHSIKVDLTLDELEILYFALNSKCVAIAKEEGAFNNGNTYTEWVATGNLQDKVYDAEKALRAKQAGIYYEDECPICHCKTYTTADAHQIETMGCCFHCSREAGDC